MTFFIFFIKFEKKGVTWRRNHQLRKYGVIEIDSILRNSHTICRSKAPLLRVYRCKFGWTVDSSYFINRNWFARVMEWKQWQNVSPILHPRRPKKMHALCWKHSPRVIQDMKCKYTRFVSLYVWRDLFFSWQIYKICVQYCPYIFKRVLRKFTQFVSLYLLTRFFEELA